MTDDPEGVSASAWVASILFSASLTSAFEVVNGSGELSTS